jgi:hypothetical protein
VSHTSTATAPYLCEKCSAELVPGRVTFYHVVVEATADPTPVVDPTLSEEDVAGQLDRLFEQMQSLPASEAMDQVQRRFHFCLCAGCYRKWIEAPAG